MLINWIQENKRVVNNISKEPYINKDNNVSNDHLQSDKKSTQVNTCIQHKKDIDKQNEELLYNYVFSPSCDETKKAEVTEESSLKVSHVPSERHQRILDGAYLVNEYENENAMNGGTLPLESVAAYDGLATSYHDLE
jgi:hypothetical protein